jgi:hypothetical protein
MVIRRRMLILAIVLGAIAAILSIIWLTKTGELFHFIGPPHLYVIDLTSTGSLRFWVDDLVWPPPSSPNATKISGGREVVSISMWILVTAFWVTTVTFLVLSRLYSLHPNRGFDVEKR